MHVVAWSRSLDDARAAELGVERMRTVPELCGRADAVTLHVALAPETRGLIGEAALRRMRPRAMLINTSRAEVVDGAALERAIAEKQLRVASTSSTTSPRAATGAFDDALGQNAGGLRHASRRRLDRAGAERRSPTRRCASCAPSSSAARCPTA